MDEIGETDDDWDLDLQQREFLIGIGIGIKLVDGKYIWRADEKGNLYQELVVNDINSYEERLKACAQRFRYALFAFIHTQTYFEYYTLTLRLASLVKKAVIYAYWTKELFDICRENVATLPSVARHVIHADNLLPRH